MRIEDDLPCQHFVELVTDYLEGRLSAELRASFEAHLEVCDGCELYLGQMRLTVRALRRRTNTAPAATVPAALLAHFRAHHGPTA